MTPLDIRLFGAIEIRHAGVLLTDFRSQKALALLAYLICTDRPVTREHLAGLAWPEVEQSQALGLLRRTLHDLISKLPDCLVVDRRTVYFQPQLPVTIDVRIFATLAAQTDPVALAQAVDLYRAPFLEGVYVDNAPELESWLLREQELWQQQMVALLARLSAQETREGAYERALHYARRLVALEPWREEAHCQVMLLLARTGQISAALVQYHTCRQILWAELAVEPAESTQALCARLQTIARRPVDKLPQFPNPFIGRTEEVTQLTRLLATRHCRLITLLGMGGIGKTRLALETAHTVANDAMRLFLDGVIFVPLGGVDTLPQVVATLGQALALAFQPQDTPATQLLHYLHDKEVLLILDNFEQLVTEPILTFVRQLLDWAPDCKLLITSRARLNLQCEQLYWMQGLQVPMLAGTTAPFNVAELGTCSSIQLFLATVRRTQPHYTVSADDLPAVLKICQLAQGMPLAIELAAPWMSLLPPAAIATEIGRNLDFLSSEAHDIPLRQRSMRAVFDTSWRLLTTTEQMVFQELSVFCGGFTVEAAQTVTGATLPLLRHLQQHSFLEYQSNRSRYTIHELLRQYGAEKLAQQPKSENRVRAKHSSYYCALLRTQAEVLKFIEQPPPQLPIAADVDNIVAAWTWATLDERIEELSQTVDCFATFFVRLMRCQEGIIHLQKTVAKLAELERRNPTNQRLQYVYAQVLAYYGNFMDIIGDRVQAQTILHESLRYLQAVDLEQTDTRALHALVLGWLGDTFYGNEALDHYARALALARAVGAEQHVAELLLAQSHIMLTTGSHPLAETRKLADEALHIHKKLNDKTGMAWLLNALSQIALHQGDHATCEQMNRESLAIHQRLAQKDGVAYRLGMLAWTALLAGKFQAAQTHAEEALTIWQELGFQGYVLEAELLLGMALLHQGNYTDARFHATTAMRRGQELGQRQETANALTLLGKVALVEANYLDARSYLQESLGHYRRLARESEVACTLARLALTAYHLQDYAAAHQYLREATYLTQKVQHFAVVLRVLPVGALLFAKAEYLRQAVDLYIWSSQQSFFRNSCWMQDLIGRRLASLLGPLSPSPNGTGQSSDAANRWKPLIDQLDTDLVTLDWNTERYTP